LMELGYRDGLSQVGPLTAFLSKEGG